MFLSLLSPRAAHLLREGGCPPGSALVYDRVISHSGPSDRREEATMKRGFFLVSWLSTYSLKCPIHTSGTMAVQISRCVNQNDFNSARNCSGRLGLLP